jgi:peptide/nickel transport system permease protein
LSAVAGAVEAGAVETTVEGRSPRQIFWSRFRQDRAAIVGGVVVIILILLAVFAGVISHDIIGHGPNDVYQDTMSDDFGIPKGPNSHFWFGADAASRDLFVRVLYGARTSLMVAGIATTISMTVGVTVGVIAGYYRGIVDTIVSRLSDVMLALPQLLLAIGIAASCGLANGCLDGAVQPGLSLVIFVISAFTWPYIARIVRSTTLSLREKEFVEAAKSLGASNTRIIFREILPNLVAPITIWTTLLIPSNILFEAGLSFLGLGVPPSTPSWGQALSDASNGGLYKDCPWLMIFPGLFLVATTLAFNLLGDGLRDALDPRSGR